jgi:hypothetical protein
MKLDFRQGIINRQKDISDTPVNLQRGSPDNSYIDLIVAPTPTVVTFAYGERNYTVIESKGKEDAWGSFTTPDDYHLFMDLNLVNGLIRYYHSKYPMIVSPIAPVNPNETQHWFDSANTYMKVFLNGEWRLKCRVLLGTFESDGSITYPALGSQVGLNGEFSSGFVVYDDDRLPLLRHDGSFVTSESLLLTNVSSTNIAYSGFQLETHIKNVSATTLIPKQTLVSLVDEDTVEICSYANPTRSVSGLIPNDLLAGDYTQLITYGRIFNPIAPFTTADINKPLFCGISGEVTLTAPNVGVSQIVGYVLDSNSFMLSIERPIYL